MTIDRRDLLRTCIALRGIWNASTARAATPQTAPRRATVKAHDGSDIAVETFGKGTTLLFARFPARQSYIDEFAGKYKLVFFEYPGRPKPETFRPAAIVRDVLAVADATRARRFVWIGYSWTAVVGLQLAIRTKRLEGLVMGGFPPLDGPYPEMLARTVQLVESAEPENVPRQRQWVAMYEGLRGFDDRAIQRRISCPRLCFVGADDQFAARIILKTRPELEKVGWDVRILDGLNHQTAAADEVMIPLLHDWLKRKVH
jgi:pimeloyl-ACP methyl ester carboxylesterase